MTCLEIIFAILGIIVALVIGGGQIYIAKRVKDFETQQDIRDEKRRTEQIYAESTRFIQKYSKDNLESEIYLLPLCVTAYKYNPVYPYRREIYREFCALTEEVQNEILKRQKIDIKSQKCEKYYDKMLARVMRNIEISYPGDCPDRYFYDRGKYFKMALENDLVSKESPDLDQLIRRDIEDRLAYHKDKRPLESMLNDFQASDKTLAAYMCCLIALYSAVYNFDCAEGVNLGNECDFQGKKCMEDIFLESLHNVEYWCFDKSDIN